ncbi:thioredoxin domain-containing protein [Taibaiella lutea]|uniref:Thioredoxin domain-containing protein n=1 Tax=Taibaiella lutea TaxID=2608001 RepID=A0A5M6CDM5_9BACT|nr:thioredoxin domain-containing protein [Taibaiella lutea]KAA5533226.1 thioredoxin domain-containing protein [Taibaiella lutea]
MPNKLQFESSPYLLQHANNPVDWFPWGEDAFEKARLEHKPVLVSIGYSACHWCHVMEHESFEDPVVADFMNKHFVNIKVDREEHPDVDHLYMDALQAMSGAGGWPLNMFVTPDKKPFYGGTYFPPKAMYGRSSWMELLQALHLAWQEKQEEIELQSNQMIAHLKQASIVSLNVSERHITEKETALAANNLLQQADAVWGGFGAAPKFPATGSIQYLLEFSHYHKESAIASNALSQALLSLDKMIEGGIYDQIGGGFSRYATDREWLVPHFEKMLYDNALLISVLSQAYKITGKERYKKVIIETIDFCNRELKDDKSGGFYCALDADSEGVEGKYYTWTWAQWNEILPDAHSALLAYFGVSKEGNWEETNILNVAESKDAILAKFNMEEEEWERIYKDAKGKLFYKRQERIRPGTDDKILLSWNALMNIALVDAGLALNETHYIREAERHMDWMLQAFKIEDKEGLAHVFKNGKATIPSKLDDYAYLVKALTTLASAMVKPEYIVEANKWLQFVETHFLTEDHTFYYFSSDIQKDIPVRKVELYDGATPSANAVLMEQLAILGNLMESGKWLEQSEGMMLAQLQSSLRYPSSFARWAVQMQRYQKGLKQVLICGKDANLKLEEWRAYFHPEAYTLATKQEERDIIATKGKLQEDKTLIYLCKDFACRMPVSEIDDLKL